MLHFSEMVNMTYSNGGIINKNNYFELMKYCFETSDDNIIWGIGLKSMIGKNWADIA